MQKLASKAKTFKCSCQNEVIYIKDLKIHILKKNLHVITPIISSKYKIPQESEIEKLEAIKYSNLNSLKFSRKLSLSTAQMSSLYYSKLNKIIITCLTERTNLSKLLMKLDQILIRFRKIKLFNSGLILNEYKIIEITLLKYHKSLIKYAHRYFKKRQTSF